MVWRTIPVPDKCGRGIIADITELYAAQKVGYFFSNTIRLWLPRLSRNCKKTKAEYLAALKQSGSRNCWGLALDFKAMYCAFYGGIEAYRSSDDSHICSTGACCTQARSSAREELAEWLKGLSVGEPRRGIIEPFMPRGLQNMPPTPNETASTDGKRPGMLTIHQTIGQAPVPWYTGSFVSPSSSSFLSKSFSHVAQR